MHSEGSSRSSLKKVNMLYPIHPFATRVVIQLVVSLSFLRGVFLEEVETLRFKENVGTSSWVSLTTSIICESQWTQAWPGLRRACLHIDSGILGGSVIIPLLWVVFLLCSVYSDKSLILYGGFPLVTDGLRTLFIHWDRDLRRVPTHSILWVFGEDLDLSPAQFCTPPRKNRGLESVPWVSGGLLVLEWQGEEGNGYDFGGSISEMLCVEEPLCGSSLSFCLIHSSSKYSSSADYLSLWTTLLFWAPRTVVNKMCWQKLETQWGVGTERFCYWTTEQLDHLRKKYYFTLKCWKTLNVLYFTTQPL